MDDCTIQNDFDLDKVMLNSKRYIVALKNKVIFWETKGIIS